MADTLRSGIVINEILVDPNGAINFDTDGNGAGNACDADDDGDGDSDDHDDSAANDGSDGCGAYGYTAAHERATRRYRRLRPRTDP